MIQSAAASPSDQPRSRETALVVLLRVGGLLTLTAIFAVFLPRSWMETIHQSLGMGALPAPPLTDYLARSTSFLYAIHGALLLLISTDVRRYRPVVLLFGWSDVFFGATMLAVDLHLGLPIWWVVVEGPGLVAIGVAVVWLASGVQRHRS